jgi:hypothetical protein
MQPKIARHMIRWILRSRGFSGVTLPPFGIYIIEERMQDEGLIRHEQAHWEQYKRVGAVRFYLTYVWQVLRYGYWNAPWEVEARAAQNDRR